MFYPGWDYVFPATPRLLLRDRMPCDYPGRDYVYPVGPIKGGPGCPVPTQEEGLLRILCPVPTQDEELSRADHVID